MVLTKTPICNFGEKLHSFQLKGVDNKLHRLEDYLGLDNHQDVANEMISLQEKYWPNAKRKFCPIDIEYQSCECRKYFSYVNGTKKFEGKNLLIIN